MQVDIVPIIKADPLFYQMTHSPSLNEHLQCHQTDVKMSGTTYTTETSASTDTVVAVCEPWGNEIVCVIWNQKSPTSPTANFNAKCSAEFAARSLLGMLLLKRVALQAASTSFEYMFENKHVFRSQCSSYLSYRRGLQHLQLQLESCVALESGDWPSNSLDDVLDVCVRFRELNTILYSVHVVPCSCIYTVYDVNLVTCFNVAEPQAPVILSWHERDSFKPEAPEYQNNHKLR